METKTCLALCLFAPKEGSITQEMDQSPSTPVAAPKKQPRKTKKSRTSDRGFPSIMGIKKLGYRAGIERQQRKGKTLYESEKRIYEECVRKIVRSSMIFAINASRTTITASDVQHAVQVTFDGMFVSI